MLFIDLKVLDKTIEFYDTFISKVLPDQLERLDNIQSKLFDSWQGMHATTFDEKFCRIIVGAGSHVAVEGEVSLRAVKERAENIRNILKEGREVFQQEMSRCTQCL